MISDADFERSVERAQAFPAARWENHAGFDWENPMLRVVADVLCQRRNVRIEALFSWQMRVLSAALARGTDGSRFRHDIVYVQVGRQSGKTEILSGRQCLGLLLGEVVVFASAGRGVGAERWRRDVDGLFLPVFGDAVKVRASSGSERVTHKGTLGTVSVVTPDEKGTRGLTIDCLLLDEARFLPMELMDAALPTLTMRHDAQAWLVSSAGTDFSDLQRHFRDKGRAGEAGMCYFEFSPPEGSDLDDPAVWHFGIPAFGEKVGPTVEKLQGFKSISTPEFWEQEYMNLWPLDEGSVALDAAAFAAQAFSALGLAKMPADAASQRFGLASDAELQNAAVVAVSMAGDRLALELVEFEQGPATSLLDRVADRCAGRKKREVVIDGKSAARALGAELQQRGVKVRYVQGQDYAAGCMALAERVHTHGMVHNDAAPFNAAVATAGRRRIGTEGRWGWRRPEQVGNVPPAPITPLEAASAAAFTVLSEPAPVRGSRKVLAGGNLSPERLAEYAAAKQEKFDAWQKNREGNAA